MTPTRRAFLKQVSAVAAVGLGGGVPQRLLWSTPPAELVPEPDEALLRELALTAMEAAHGAGAEFADVRVVAGDSISFGCTATYRQGGAPEMQWPDLTSRSAYGIRAVANGTWGFASGTELTPDAVRGVAVRAVARARSNRRPQAHRLEQAPVPEGEEGTWATPIEQDPFDVPVGEQADVLLAALAEAGRIEGIHSGFAQLRWNRNLRVFASSDDALIVQRMAVAVPIAGAGVARTDEWSAAFEYVPGLRRGPYGYESLTNVDLNEEMRQAAERAVIESRRPDPPAVQVGRYDMVFGATAMASLLSTTIATALNLERALGYQANSSGTSFAAPPADILGKFEVGGPLLTVRADRTRVGGAATVGWDDEGVRPRERALVQDGVITDYLTNRQTAAELAEWYGSRGEPVRSGGFASGAGPVVPTVRLPNLTMEAGQEDLSVEDLIADTRKGFYIDRSSGVSDQQVLSTQGWTSRSRVREIRDGQLGDRVRDLAFQFITPAFWNRLDGIGGPESSVEITQGTGYPAFNPLQLPYATVEVVPARVREVNVLNYGRTL